MTRNESNQVQIIASTPGPAQAGGRRAIVVGAIVVCAAYAVFEGIHSRVEAKAELRQVAINSAIPFVNIVHPKSGAEAEEIELPGNTEAFTDTPIYARTNGYVKHWYVDIGTRVRQGQLLAEIETPELDQQLRQAKADLENALANLQIAQITATRWQNLLKTDSVSHQETDQAISDLHAKQALVDSNRANVDRLEQLQSFERIIAPVDGVITARNTDIGALIQADTTSPKEIFHLSAIQKLRIYVPVPEVYASSVKTGDKVGVTLDAFPGQTFTGTLVRNADAIDPASRTLNVEVDVDNSTGRLMPGAYAFVHFKVPATNGAVTIPSNALLFRSEGLRVGVVRNSHVALLPITVGQDYGDAVEVLSGLTARDPVIVNPSDSLADGAQVQVENKTANGVGKRSAIWLSPRAWPSRGCRGAWLAPNM
jgi:RND family efflux transporter MFP subunit